MRTIFSKGNDLYSGAFQLGTDIMEDDAGHRFVKKYPLCEEAKPHLHGMKQGFDAFGGSYGGYTLAPVREEGDALLFDFISGENGTARLLDVLRREGTDGLLRELKQMLDNMPEPDCAFSSSGEFCAMFGREPIPEGSPARTRSFLDFTSGNIIFRENQWVFIDYEWFMPFPVPVDLLKTHFVECLYTFVPELTEAIQREDVYAFLEIENGEQFRRCRDHFLNDTVMNEDSMSRISSRYLKAAYPVGNHRNGKDILQRIQEMEEQRDYQSRLLTEQKRGLKEKDDWIAEQGRQLEYQAQVIGQKEEVISQKDAWIAEQADQLKYQAQVIGQKEEAISQKDAWIGEQAGQLEYQTQVIAQKEEAISQKDAWIAEQAGQLEYQTQVITQKEDAISQKDAWIVEQADQLEYQAQVIGQKEEAISQKDAWIAEQADQLEYQAQVIAQNEQALQQKEAWIVEQGVALAKKEEEIARLEEKLEAEHKKRLTIQERLYAIENSKFWQYTATFHKKLDEKDF